ncbi:unnamed protein product [Brassica oleracea]
MATPLGRLQENWLKGAQVLEHRSWSKLFHGSSYVFGGR